MERTDRTVVAAAAVEFVQNGVGFSGTKVFWLFARVIQCVFFETPGFHPIDKETGQ